MKRYLKFIVTIMILLSILVALSGCGIKSDVETIEEKTRRELEETTEIIEISSTTLRKER